MATFGGSTFGLLVRSPGHERAAQIAEMKIPGGDTTYFDVAGKQPPRISGRAKFSSYAAFKTFRDLVGTTGTLVYSEESGGVAALLLRVGRDTVLPGGATFAIVEWVLTA